TPICSALAPRSRARLRRRAPIASVPWKQRCNGFLSARGAGPCAERSPRADDSSERPVHLPVLSSRAPTDRPWPSRDRSWPSTDRAWPRRSSERYPPPPMPTRKTPKPSRALARTAAKASTAAARRAEALIEIVAIKKTEIEDAFYELGLALRELATKK